MVLEREGTIMGNRAQLTQEEKERIYQGKLQGRTLPELAKELRCSVETTRKWWRTAREKGLSGLRVRRRGRSATGILSRFQPLIAEKAEVHKHTHPGWGAERVLIELRQDPQLVGFCLPKRSRLASFFKKQCPECVARRTPRPPAPGKGSKATAVHEIWQLDNQEGIELTNGEVAIICNIRDPFGAAPIASQAFSGKTQKRWRKLEVAEFRQVLRAGFTEWQTLPDSVWTDNELRLIGNPSSDFPSLLTLYLAGLGIKHEFIRPGTPTDQPQVERGHRTLDDWALDEEARKGIPQLQQALDRERRVYLLEFPCQASDCAGRPPLIAHPELLHPRRYFQPDLELQLFSLQRVYDYLATFTFERKISDSGCVALTRQVSIGRKFARLLKDRLVWVRCDPLHHEWVIYKKPANEQTTWIELVRRPIKNLDVEPLTGLDPRSSQPAIPVQLTLPFLVA